MNVPTMLELPGVVLGRLVEVDGQGRPCVQWSDQDPAVAEVVWMSAQPDWRRCLGGRVILCFPGGDENRPIVLGLLDPPRISPPSEPGVLRVTAERELVIECGKAKIALSADGRVEIRGTHLVSRSSGPNKVKGATVHIN